MRDNLNRQNKNKAVFFDRDGVLNELIFNPATGEYESPHQPRDFVITPGLGGLLAGLKAAGYLFFVVSNQPSYAKGKTSMQALLAIHSLLRQVLEEQGINFSQYYYCYHHPTGVMPELSGPCACRKPKPYFLLEAAKTWNLDLGESWMVGDQDTDIQCGQAAGVKTLLIENPLSASKRGAARANLRAADLRSGLPLLLAAAQKTLR